MSYHHGDTSVSYPAAKGDHHFFQMYASVNTYTMINLHHNHTDTCTSRSIQTTIFRHLNTLNYCTFSQFHSNIHLLDWSKMSGLSTLWKTWKGDEETWTMLGQSNQDPQTDAKMWVLAVTRFPLANFCLSFQDKMITPVPAGCNIPVTWQVNELRMRA